MNWIIAESGGTKTDWKICIDGKIIERKGKSLHPSQLSSELLSEEKEFWSNYELSSLPLRFFGAGALRSEGKEKIQSFLSEIGFNEISVQSDLHIAGITSYKNETGWVAIMGTGSVLFYWNGKESTEIIGGKGHLLGDEGSGYYFGKLVLEAYKEGKLTEKQVQELKQLDFIPEKNQKFETASLSKKLSSEFLPFHQQNIEIFKQTHFNEPIQKLCIVGSYGFNNQITIKSQLNASNIKFIQFPIQTIHSYGI